MRTCKRKLKQQQQHQQKHAKKGQKIMSKKNVNKRALPAGITRNRCLK